MIHVDARDMQRVARMIRETSDRELQKNFDRALQEAIEPAKEAVRSSASSELPHRGGLAAKVAGGKFRVQKQAGGVSLSMTVDKRAGGNYDLRRLDQGRLRHPVFGGRKWVQQQVPSGWWTRPLQQMWPEITRKVNGAVEDFARELARKAR